MSFFLFQDLIQDTILHVVIMFIFSSLWPFLSLFLLFMTLRLLKSICQVVCRIYFSWVCLLFSHYEAGVLAFLEDYHRVEYLSSLLILSFLEYVIFTWILTGQVDPDFLVKVASAVFLHSRNAYFFPSILLLEVSHKVQCILEEKGITSWREGFDQSVLYVAMVKSTFQSWSSHRSTELPALWLVETLLGTQSLSHLHLWILHHGIYNLQRDAHTYWLHDWEPSCKYSKCFLFAPIKKGSLLSLKSVSMWCLKYSIYNFIDCFFTCTEYFSTERKELCFFCI